MRIRDSSTFNGIALFGASTPTIVTLQVGANGNIDAANNTNRIGVTLVALNFTTVSMDVSQIDTAISSVSQARSDLGAVQNRLEHAVANLGVYEENLTRLRVADPRRGRGIGDGQLHAAADPVAVRHRDARPGEPVRTRACSRCSAADASPYHLYVGPGSSSDGPGPRHFCE